MQNLVQITFRSLQSRDQTLLTRWISKPHMQEWWGAPEREVHDIFTSIQSGEIEGYIFALDGEEIGYIQCYQIGRNMRWAKEQFAPWFFELPDDYFGVDMSIGEEGWLGRGVGSKVLRLFCDQLFAKGANGILIDPDCQNLRAIKAYEKVGFRFYREYKNPEREAECYWIMINLRSESGAAP